MVFKPGQSGNPGGRVKMPKEVREAAAMNRADFQRILNRLIRLPMDELKVIAQNPKGESLEIFVATIIFRGMKDGCSMRLGMLLDRLIGRVKEEIDHNVALEGAGKMEFKLHWADEDDGAAASPAKTDAPPEEDQ